MTALPIVFSAPSAAIAVCFAPEQDCAALAVAAIERAHHQILASAYNLTTGAGIVEALVRARVRGVDVRLMLPSQSDSQAAFDVGRSHYDDLLEAGVKIYEIQNEVLHSKTAVIDGVWSVIGSSNFDHRSVIFNDEVDAVVLGTDTAGELESMFTDDEKGAKAIDRKTWNDRPLAQKMTEIFAIGWQKLL